MWFGVVVLQGSGGCRIQIKGKNSSDPQGQARTGESDSGVYQDM